MSKHGRVYWNELNTWDQAKAMSYYGAVLGWTFDKVETAGTDKPRPYYVAKRDGEPVAGVFQMYSPNFDGIGEHWFTYISVEDLEDAIAKSSEAGGQLCRPPFLIPGFGTMAVIQAAGGAFQAFIQPTTD